MVALTEPTPAEDMVGDLLPRARAGDAEAFCALARSLESRLFRQAMAMGGSRETAEDLVVETLTEAWRSLARYDGSCRFTTWLYAILLHRWQKVHRRARSRPISLSSLPVGEAENHEQGFAESVAEGGQPGEMLRSREDAGRLRRAIEELSETHQQVVLLRFYEDASLGETAAALGISVGTVKSRLHYALEKLRRSEDLVNLLQEAREP